MLNYIFLKKEQNLRQKSTTYSFWIGILYIYLCFFLKRNGIYGKKIPFLKKERNLRQKSTLRNFFDISMQLPYNMVQDVVE